MGQNFGKVRSPSVPVIVRVNRWNSGSFATHFERCNPFGKPGSLFQKARVPGKIEIINHINQQERCRAYVRRVSMQILAFLSISIHR
jgi:hypothetical protein